MNALLFANLDYERAESDNFDCVVDILCWPRKEQCVCMQSPICVHIGKRDMVLNHQTLESKSLHLSEFDSEQAHGSHMASSHVALAHIE